MPKINISISAVSVLALAFANRASAAPPKTLWEISYDGHAYGFHPHGSPAKRISFADTKKAIDTLVQEGEWIFPSTHDFSASAPEAEWTELHELAKKRGVTFSHDWVLLAEIPGGRDYTKGRPTTVTVELSNHSPYRIAVTSLAFDGCGVHAKHVLAKPIVVEPMKHSKVRVVLDPKTFVRHGVIPANCMPGDGWGEFVDNSYDVI